MLIHIIIAVASPSDPLAAELARFPPPALVADALRFNEAFQRYHELRRDCDSRDFLWHHSAVLEAEWRREAWETLQRARDPAFSIDDRRAALDALHDLIGARRFALGRMPACVPLWVYGLSQEED